MTQDYYELCLNFLKGEPEKYSTDEFIQKLFFLYPSLKVNVDLLHKITSQISITLNIPYHDIKVIGSSHTGFSFIDKDKKGTVKFYDSTAPSDIDIAIINDSIFIDILEKTVIRTENYSDNTAFKNAHLSQYFKKNIPSGFIRPDSIGCEVTREKWVRFFSDLSSEHDLKISGAIYLNETFFIKRLKKQIETFQNIEEVQNGIK
ncbi:hypothetical protein ABVF54_05715 [Enterococcus mundtii]|uniref:Uncharacterized protein n=1 Tax=Enterococcus mundtii TaxID=53346 RepID=A0AAI8R767_ENTMU|nr:hypothetical protein [Enterococcus mundtii]BBM13547.1 uncharacterized protein EM151A_0305 [Enterococcus mundtii]